MCCGIALLVRALAVPRSEPMPLTIQAVAARCLHVPQESVLTIPARP